MSEPTLQDFTSLKTAALAECANGADAADFAVSPQLVVKVIESIELLQATALSGSKGSGPVTRQELEAILGSLGLVYDGLDVSRRVLNLAAFPHVSQGINHVIAIYNLIAGKTGMASHARQANTSADMSKVISEEAARQAAPAPLSVGAPQVQKEVPLSATQSGVEDVEHYEKNENFGGW